MSGFLQGELAMLSVSKGPATLGFETYSVSTSVLDSFSVCCLPAKLPDVTRKGSSG